MPERGSHAIYVHTLLFFLLSCIERRRKPVRLAIKRSRQLPSPRDAIRAADLPSLFSSSRASCRPIKKCPVAQFGWEARRVCGFQPLRCLLVGLLPVLACWLRWVWGGLPIWGTGFVRPLSPPSLPPTPTKPPHTYGAQT